MLALLRRCVDGWPCMIGDLQGRKMRTGSKIKNPSTSYDGESRELQLLLFNFLCVRVKQKTTSAQPAGPRNEYKVNDSAANVLAGIPQRMHSSFHG